MQKNAYFIPREIEGQSICIDRDIGEVLYSCKKFGILKTEYATQSQENIYEE